MLTILSEDFSSSALQKLVQNTAQNRKKCILIVPEQQTLYAEATMAKILPSDAPLYFEVSNFSRLANTVFRALGGISYRYADKAASALLMWKVFDAAHPLLAAPSTENMTDRVSDTLSVLNELYAAGADESALEKAAGKLSDNDRLRDRLRDLALIFRLYKGERAELYGSLAEDLDRLGAVLEENAFFADTLFFVDSFTSFTAQEYRILAALVRMTDVTVALTLPQNVPFSLSYAETEDTAHRLSALAEKAGVPILRQTEEASALPDGIAHAKAHLFRADKKLFPSPDGNKTITPLLADDPFSAAAFIASDIAARVQSGARYRDFVIFARDCRAYRGILDEALRAQGLPFFMSEERDIMNFAAIKMIMTAYDIAQKDYRKEDVIAYLKCGMSGFSDDDIDIFELYADFWRLNGAFFRQAEDLTMSPSGYGANHTAQEEETLARINALRRQFSAPLEKLRQATGEPITVRAHAEILFRFLRETECEERLSAFAQRAKEAGNEAEADTLSRLFRTICNLLDTAVETVGELVLDRGHFAEVLRILFGSVGLGQLPASADAVMVGNADMLRADAPRFVYLLGVNEGEFPAAVKSRGTFDDNERAILSELGIFLDADPLLRAAREEFCFLRSLCAAKERVLAIAFTEDTAGKALSESLVFGRLQAMYGQAERADGDAFHPSAAIALVGEDADTEKGNALRTLLKEDVRYADLFAQDAPPLSDTECTLGADLSATLFPKEMHLTQSRIESYANCPFAYYCRYLLSLSEKTDATFSFADIGTMIHAVLERLFDRLEKKGETIRSVKKEDLSQETKQILLDYIEEICPKEMRDSPRLKHLFDRLYRTSLLLAEELYDEFAQSKFSPTFFEFAIGKKGAPDPIIFETEDGHRMLFYGVIDRVDSYRDENGKLYLRVVDYKTGTKVFSPSDVAKGRNLQLLIYLFSLWKSGDKDFLASLGLKDGEMPIPGGALYMSASPQDVKLTEPMAEAEVKAMAKDSLARSGLILKDEAVIRAMDATLSGHYVPLSLDKNGNIKWTDHFATAERMGEILSEMQTTLSALGTAMHRGCANAAPKSVREAGKDVCSYCSFHAVCRHQR